MEWFRDFPGVANIHTLDELTRSPAPNVYDNSGSRSALSQYGQLDRGNRFIVFSSLHREGLWWNWLRQPGHHAEEAPPGFVGETFSTENGYYFEQTASEEANTIIQDSLIDLMRQRNQPGTLGWMEPHGEFMLKHCPSLPPNYGTRFPNYLREVKKHTLATVSDQYTGDNSTYKSWRDIPYPDPSYFYGRRNNFHDLDDIKWNWHGGGREVGEAEGWYQPSFDDSSWKSDYRDSKILLCHLSANRKTNIAPLWYRFEHTIPESFLAAVKGGEVYLHLMPYSKGEGMKLSVWLNGEKVADNLTDHEKWYMDHVQVEIGSKNQGRREPLCAVFARWSNCLPCFSQRFSR